MIDLNEYSNKMAMVKMISKSSYAPEKIDLVEKFMNLSYLKYEKYNSNLHLNTECGFLWQDLLLIFGLDCTHWLLKYLIIIITIIQSCFLCSLMIQNSEKILKKY